MLKWFRSIRHDILESLYISKGEPMWLRVKGIIWVLYQWSRLSTTICLMRGHKWECDSYAGCDSGWEDISCERCGEHHHITYY